MCWKSHPPHPPGCEYWQGDEIRSGEALTISTASARTKLAPVLVISASTTSPGIAWRTKIT